MVASWRGGPRAVANPWRALTLEWQVSSPPPIFNFDAIPTVVGGPYEYGVPGAVHGVFKAPRRSAAPAGTHAHDHGRVGGAASCKTILVVANETLGGRCAARRDQGEGGRRRRRARRRLRPAHEPAPRQHHLRRRRVRRRAGAHRPRAQVPARARASTRSARSATPTPTPPRWTRSPSTTPTRSSSRPTRRRRRAGCGATSSSASPRRPALPVEHVVVDLDAGGPALRRHARRRQPHRRLARPARGAQGRARASCERHLFIVVVPQEGGDGVAARPGARAPDAGASTALRAAGLICAGHDRRPRPLHRDR